MSGGLWRIAAAPIAAVVFGLLAPAQAVAGRAAAPEGSGDTIVITAANTSRKMTLPVGKSLIVDLPEDAGEIFVGNPSIANAVVRSARRIYLMAMANGQTTVFALDKAGRQIATLSLVVVGRDLSELQRILDTAMPGNAIKVQGIDDTVILTGSVASAVEAQRAQDIASAFVGYTAVGSGGASSSGSGSSINFGSTQIVSGQIVNSLVIRGQEQVTLKVSVVEIQREIAKQLGIATGGSFGSTGVYSWNPVSMTSVPGGALASTSSGLSSGGQGLSLFGKYGSLQAALQAFERAGVAHTLAEPTVTAISGESAKFTAGGSVPVAQSSSIDTKTGVCTITTQLQNYGVTLNFTPTVLSEGRISLHLATEVTEPDGTQAANTACSNSIGFRTRKNETTVELPSGGSIVTAGLVSQISKQAMAGTPGLMNLPILGALFRSRDYQREESELMIVVTPYLAKSLRPDQVSRPDDGFTDPSDPQSWLLGRMNKIYSTSANPALIRNYRGRVGFIND